MYLAARLIVLVCAFRCYALAALPAGFYLDIDGSSVALALSEICVLEAQIGVEIGTTDRHNCKYARNYVTM
jgi:hypothetical protein